MFLALGPTREEGINQNPVPEEGPSRELKAGTRGEQQRKHVGGRNKD